MWALVCDWLHPVCAPIQAVSGRYSVKPCGTGRGTPVWPLLKGRRRRAILSSPTDHVGESLCVFSFSVKRSEQWLSSDEPSLSIGQLVPQAFSAAPAEASFHYCSASDSVQVVRSAPTYPERERESHSLNRNASCASSPRCVIREQLCYTRAQSFPRSLQNI